MTAPHALEAALRRDVEALAGTIGERHVGRPEGLAAAADYLEAEWAAMGYAVARQRYTADRQPCDNLEVTCPGGGRASEILVVGAHYDAVFGSPGANDNGSGVAALLALSRAFHGRTPARTVRFVAFVNEEPPYFQTREMGSWVYAERCRARRERIIGMVSLETLGYFDDTPGSQQFPLEALQAMYPTTGNFIAMVGEPASAALLEIAARAFRAHSDFPLEAAVLPAEIPGVGWSDQWAFWQEGYPGLMLTDTAPYRYPHYHTREDTPDKLRYDRLARLVAAIIGMTWDLANP